ncbi:hypothetical protein AVEN_224876-1 [Araneus ventricosus]|uniref:Uncharacterized protein n=1 Tax=Araneus ventricosus TaxID=182803 RepID=A0A4Y2GVX3_ARAVE|nr:hypothetical protein AVEN_224876-1 [Araneus ventricosus]
MDSGNPIPSTIRRIYGPIANRIMRRVGANDLPLVWCGSMKSECLIRGCPHHLTTVQENQADGDEVEFPSTFAKGAHILLDFVETTSNILGNAFLIQSEQSRIPSSGEFSHM